jgi:hypothetical protein
MGKFRHFSPHIHASIVTMFDVVWWQLIKFSARVETITGNEARIDPEAVSCGLLMTKQH